jgi:hypothetical protein
MIIVRRVINRRANFNLDDDLRDAFDKANRKYRNSYKPPEFNFGFMKEENQKLNPKLLLAGLAATTAVGAGAYFIRKRKSKNGKQTIERVRKK